MILQIAQNILLILVAALVLAMIITAITNLFFAKVPFVPTRKRDIENILNSISPSENAKFFDLGCGDGRFLFQAEKKYGIRGTGYELSLIPFLIAKTRQIFSGRKSEIKFKDLFKAELSDADIIFCYLFPKTINDVAEKIKHECKKGTKLISNTFQIKDMEPIKIITDEQNKKRKIYIYEF